MKTPFAEQHTQAQEDSPNNINPVQVSPRDGSHTRSNSARSVKSSFSSCFNFLRRRREGPSLSRIPSIRRSRVAANESLQELRALRSHPSGLPGGSKGKVESREVDVSNTLAQQQQELGKSRSISSTEELKRCRSSSSGSTAEELKSVYESIRVRSSSTRCQIKHIICFSTQKCDRFPANPI